MYRIKKAAAAIYGWDRPLLTFIYPGFDCGSCDVRDGAADAAAFAGALAALGLRDAEALLDGVAQRTCQRSNRFNRLPLQHVPFWL